MVVVSEEVLVMAVAQEEIGNYDLGIIECCLGFGFSFKYKARKKSLLLFSISGSIIEDSRET